ncbi:MAG: R3H domain-containing nucleic acid-binding protein, partial [Dehalococcoidia bacterium]
GSEEAIVRVTAKDSAVGAGGRGRGGRGRGGRGARGGGDARVREPEQPEVDRGQYREEQEREDRYRDEESREAAPSGDESPSADGEPRRRRGRRGGRRRGGGGAEGRAPEGGTPEGDTPESGTPEGGEAPADAGRPAAGPAGRGGRPEGRGGRGGGPSGGRGTRAEHSEERVIGVDVDEQVRIPGAPDDAPDSPASEYADEIDRAGSSLRDVLNLLGLSTTSISARDPETPGDGVGLISQVIEVYGEDDDTSDELGLLIGRRGETLASLQYLINTIVAHHAEGEAPVFGIDIEGYRRRREQTLVDLAREVAQEVRETGDVITLEPMPAAERRIVHLTLEEEPGVRTESVGSGENRQVEVLPE